MIRMPRLLSLLSIGRAGISMKFLWILLSSLLWISAADAACPSWLTSLSGSATCSVGDPTVATNAALKAATAGYTNYVYRTGYYAAGDGGDALYVWNGSSTCTDDGGSCIVPASAPSTGRWILNSNGAVSVMVFGAHCDDGTTVDDSPAINAALVARTAVFIPANTTCTVNMTSPSSGLVLNDGNHFYGQNRQTSTLLVCGPNDCGQGSGVFSGTYDFVAGARFGPSIGSTGIVVSSHVGTVNTFWSHDMQVGNTVIITDSVDTGVGGTFTIVSVPTPNTFTINMPSAANGTYVTNVTALKGQSNIGTDVIKSACRESGPTGCSTRVEIDNLRIWDLATLNVTLIDMIQMINAHIHDITMDTGGPGSGSVGLVCSDLSPGGIQSTCYFNRVNDLNGELDTLLHISGVYDDSAISSFQQFSGYIRIGIDTSGTNNVSQAKFALFENWYMDQSPNSWDFFVPDGYLPGDSTFINVFFEATTNPVGVDTQHIAFLGATPGRNILLSGTVNTQAIVSSYRASPGGAFTAGANDFAVSCPFGGTTVNLPASPVSQYQGSGGIILVLQAKGNGSCAVSGNGNTISGFGSSMTVNSGQTVMLQWNTQYNDWEPIIAPNNQLYVTTVGSLPGCSASLLGVMFAVTDADATSQTTYNHIVTSGGTGAKANISVFCNGTNWVSQ
jgi:hypothetical protein